MNVVDIAVVVVVDAVAGHFARVHPQARGEVRVRQIDATVDDGDHHARRAGHHVPRRRRLDLCEAPLAAVERIIRHRRGPLIAFLCRLPSFLCPQHRNRPRQIVRLRERGAALLQRRDRCEHIRSRRQRHAIDLGFRRSRSARGAALGFGGEQPLRPRAAHLRQHGVERRRPAACSDSRHAHQHHTRCEFRRRHGLRRNIRKPCIRSGRRPTRFDRHALGGRGVNRREQRNSDCEDCRSKASEGGVIHSAGCQRTRGRVNGD